LKEVNIEKAPFPSKENSLSTRNKSFYKKITLTLKKSWFILKAQTFYSKFCDYKNDYVWSYQPLWSLYKAIQAARVICGLFICNFVYMRSGNGLFSGTYPLIYSNPWSFYMRIHYMRAYFWSPYLSHITRSNCIYFTK